MLWHFLFFLCRLLNAGVSHWIDFTVYGWVVTWISKTFPASERLYCAGRSTGEQISGSLGLCYHPGGAPCPEIWRTEVIQGTEGKGLTELRVVLETGKAHVTALCLTHTVFVASPLVSFPQPSGPLVPLSPYFLLKLLTLTSQRTLCLSIFFPWTFFLLPHTSCTLPTLKFFPSAPYSGILTHPSGSTSRPPCSHLSWSPRCRFSTAPFQTEPSGYCLGYQGTRGKQKGQGCLNQNRTALNCFIHWGTA